MKVYEGSTWVAAYASLSGALLVANNLSDLNDAGTARTNLGLGTAATTASTDYATAAQGTLADSAVQPGDNISSLTNDAGYVTTDTNTTYSAGTGITLTGTTFSNAAPDQTVSLTGSGATSVSGTYPSFTISSTDTNTTYSVATSSTLGLVKIGYVENGKNYPVELSSGQMYVNVPWTDTDTVYSLPEATSTTRGGIELFSDTDQTVAANTVTTTSGRTYGIQLNSSGQAVVNVPWVNTDTNTTYSAGTGLSLSGTTFNLTSPYTYIDQATGNYGTIKVDDDRGVSWAGYAIRDDWVFMSDGTNAGIYNDTDNEWAIYCARNGGTALYYNGTSRITTSSNGADINGNLSVTANIDYVDDIYLDSQIISYGDTDTYLQFHAANQWRVVTGGSERLEVNNSFVSINNAGFRAGTYGPTNNSGNFTPDFHNYNIFMINMTGNITLVNTTTGEGGQTGLFLLYHSGGARTVSLQSYYQTVGGAGLTLSSSSSVYDIVPYVILADGFVKLGNPILGIT